MIIIIPLERAVQTVVLLICQSVKKNCYVTRACCVHAVRMKLMTRTKPQRLVRFHTAGECNIVKRSSLIATFAHETRGKIEMSFVFAGCLHLRERWRKTEHAQNSAGLIRDRVGFIRGNVSRQKPAP